MHCLAKHINAYRPTAGKQLRWARRAGSGRVLVILILSESAQTNKKEQTPREVF